MSEAEDRNEQLVANFFATLSTGDLDRLRPLFHKDASWEVMAKSDPFVGEKKGREVILREFLAPVRGNFEDGDPKVTIKRMISKGPLVAAETTAVGRLKNGKTYDNAYAWMIEVKDGKIFCVHEYMDSHAARR
jgi:hypothetical protein